MQILTLGLIALISHSRAETINRDVVNEASAAECTSFPCVINCNAANSCRNGIQCPTTGSGLCTINLYGDSAAETGTLDGGSADSLFINVYEYEGLYRAKVNVGGIGNIEIYSTDSYRSMYDASFVIGDMTGDFKLTVDGDSYHAFYTADIIINSIGGDFIMTDNTTRTSTSRNFALSTVTINGDVGGDVILQTTELGDALQSYSFYAAKFTVGGDIGGDLMMTGYGYYTFNIYQMIIEGNVVGNVELKDVSVRGRNFYAATALLTINGGIGGKFIVIDMSEKGYGFYNSEFIVNGSIGDDVTILCATTGTSGNTGSSFQSTEFYLAYDEELDLPTGQIEGDLTVIDDSTYGNGFSNAKYKFGSVTGDVLFQSKTDTGRQAFDVSQFAFGAIGGDLSFLCNSFGTFSESSIMVYGDVKGSVLLEDTSLGGYGFYNDPLLLTITGSVGGDCTFRDNSTNGLSFYNSEVRINGNIYGAVTLEDLSTSSGGGRSFQGSEFFLAFDESTDSVTGTIGGPITMYEDNTYGYGFQNGRYKFGNVNSYVKIYNGEEISVSRGALENSQLVFGEINGDLTMINNRYGLCRVCIIRIDGSVKGDVTLLDTGNLGRGFGDGPNMLTIYGDVEGDFVLIDESDKGYGFYNSEFRVFGDLQGKVQLEDQSTGNLGRAFYGSEFYLAYDEDTDKRIGTIAGPLTMFDNSSYGQGFAYGKYYFADIDSYVTLSTGYDNEIKRGSFQNSIFEFGEIDGDLTMLSTRYGSFLNNQIFVNGDVAGNVDMIDTSKYGYGFANGAKTLTINGSIEGNFTLLDMSGGGNAARTSGFRVYGDIDGDVTIEDQAYAGAGYSMYHGDYYLAYSDIDDTTYNINGNVRMIENSSYGYCCAYGIYKFGSVKGYALFESVQDSGRQSFDVSQFYIKDVGDDLSFLSNSFGSFSESKILIDGDVGGDLTFLDTSTGGYSFYNSLAMYIQNGDLGGSFTLIDSSERGYTGGNSEWRVYGNIGGPVLVKDISTGTAGGRSFYSSEFYLAYDDVNKVPNGTINGDVSFIEDSTYGYSFYTSLYHFGDIIGNFLAQSVRDVKRSAFYNSDIVITSLTGDLNLLSNSYRSFGQLDLFVNGPVGGNVLFLDTASTGYGFQNADFQFAAEIGGHFYAKDETGTGTTSGYSFHQAKFTLLNIGAEALFSEDSYRGYAFKDVTFTIGSVVGDLTFISLNPEGDYSFYSSVWDIGSVFGDVTFSSVTFYAFGQSKIALNGDISGEVLFLDNAKKGQSFYNNDFDILGKLAKNLKFIDNSTDGLRAFYSPLIDIKQVAGNVLFDSRFDKGTIGQSFYAGKFNLDKVGGDITFNARNYQGFMNGQVQINTCGGDITFYASSERSYEFYSLDVVLGENTTSTEVIIDSSAIYSMYTSTWDAQNAEEFVVRCEGVSDCRSWWAKCPEDNQNNQCRVYCDTDTNCNSIDLFTTNGYCTDAAFYCESETCGITTANQVFCTSNTAREYDYGVRGPYCRMEKDANDILTCVDYSTAQCASSIAVCPPPPEFTISPTEAPTKAPCNETILPYNVEFVLEESRVVGKKGYSQSIKQVSQLLRKSIPDYSSVAFMSYANQNDWAWQFDDPQGDRDAIIDAINAEKEDFVRKFVDLYNALKEALNEFDDAPITNGNNMMVLYTSGAPQCGQKDKNCVESLCSDQSLAGEIKALKESKNVKLYIVGSGKFRAKEVACLVESTDDIYNTNSFTNEVYDSLQKQFLSDICGDSGATSYANVKHMMNMEVEKEGVNVHMNASILIVMIAAMVLLFGAVYGCNCNKNTDRKPLIQSRSYAYDSVSCA